MHIKAIAIPIHSFVDLITNSSSETFVTATDKTVTTLEQLIDNLLAGTGKTSNDLVDISLEPGTEYEPAKVVVAARDESSQETAALIRKLCNTFETTEVYN